MKVTVLGCGSSIGVPSLGNNWGRCDPANPRNRRRRCSVLVENGDFALLVDTSPDLREQLLDADAQRIDAVLYTHGHADHTHGVDDLRPMFWRMGRQIEVYGDRKTLDMLEGRFGYMFRASANSPSYFRPPLAARELALEPFRLGGMEVRPVRQDHGAGGESLGFVFDGRFAYSTDVATMTEGELERLRGLEVWIVDCLRERESLAHSGLARTLSWIEAARPRRAYLTHMTSDLDYDWLMARLPPGVEPAYDGLALEF